MDHTTSMAAVRRASEKPQKNDPALERESVKREIEAEAVGLMLAARMQGFTLKLMNGTATVIDTRGAPA